MSEIGHPNEVFEIWMCRFCGLRFSLSDAKGEESDGVELEESNVLMGPTGSGLSKTFLRLCFGRAE
jgi:hypothetical protein